MKVPAVAKDNSDGAQNVIHCATGKLKGRQKGSHWLIERLVHLMFSIYVGTKNASANKP